MSDMSFALIVQNKYRYYRDSSQKVKSLNSLVCIEVRRTAIYMEILQIRSVHRFLSKLLLRC